MKKLWKKTLELLDDFESYCQVFPEDYWDQKKALIKHLLKQQNELTKLRKFKREADRERLETLNETYTGDDKFEVSKTF